MRYGTRVRRCGAVACLLVLSCTQANTSEAPTVSEVAPTHPAPLGLGGAAVLGLVEGITEFLPISSTGHLILADHFLRLNRDDQARDAAGTPLWIEPPGSEDAPAGQPFTIKHAADTYAVIIQAGAIAAVAILYWRTLLTIAAGLLGRDAAGLRLLRNLLIAFAPAAVFGLTLEDFIDEHLFSVPTVVAALVVGALIMLVADRRHRRIAAHTGGSETGLLPADLTPAQALFIGLLQCVAMWPGMSRSMMTIVGGYYAGLRPARAAEFSFLLGLITLSAAAGYKALGAGAPTVAAFGWPPVLCGIFVAALSAAAAVRWLVGYLNRHGLSLFAWYRVALAAAVLLLLRN